MCMRVNWSAKGVGRCSSAMPRAGKRLRVLNDEDLGDVAHGQ